MHTHFNLTGTKQNTYESYEIKISYQVEATEKLEVINVRKVIMILNQFEIRDSFFAVDQRLFSMFTM